jgi:hypothetical protein
LSAFGILLIQQQRECFEIVWIRLHLLQGLLVFGYWLIVFAVVPRLWINYKYNNQLLINPSPNVAFGEFFRLYDILFCFCDLFDEKSYLIIIRACKLTDNQKPQILKNKRNHSAASRQSKNVQRPPTK